MPARTCLLDPKPKPKPKPKPNPNPNQARTCLLDLQPLALRTDARIESPRTLAYLDPGSPGQPRPTPAGAWRKTVRRDGYRDCLHFCSPGPLRLVPALLQQMLRGCAAAVVV